MAYYRRGFRRGYGRAYRRWYARRGWTRSWRRGSMSRRIASGTRTFSMTVPMENIFTVNFLAGQFNSVVQCIEPFYFNPSAASPELLCCPLIQSQLYRTYAQLYDDVKIDWCSYEISILDPIGGESYNAVRLWTAVDRRVTKNDVSDINQAPTAPQIRNMSSAQGTMFVNNSRAVVRRYIAASDLGERITYHDCSFNTTAAPNISFVDHAWYDGNNNITFFCPGLWFFIESTVSTGSTRAISVSVKCKYGVTFRNAKFGLAVTGNAGPKSAAVPDKRDGSSVEVLPDVEDAVKSESVKPVLTGMAKDALARLSLYVSDVPDEYEKGDNDWREDLEFLISKVGVDGVRKYFPEGCCLEYDKYLKDRGDMDDDVTVLVKDSKS